MSRIVRAALVQARWTGNAASMVDRHESTCARPPSREPG
jgi:hypothetical protein